MSYVYLVYTGNVFPLAIEVLFISCHLKNQLISPGILKLEATDQILTTGTKDR